MMQKLAKGQLEKNVEELLNVSYSIKEIYKKLVESEILSNQRQYDTYLGYLDMCRELEDKLYGRLSNENLNRIKLILKKLESEKNFGNSGLVKSRIVNYLCHYQFINPFYHIDSRKELEELKSCTESPFTCEKSQLLGQIFSITGSELKNELGIVSQFFLDFYQIFIYFLKQEIDNINNTKNIKFLRANFLRANLIQLKYEYIIACRAIEKKLLLEDLSECLIFTNKERAILFNHDKAEVHQVYYQEANSSLAAVFNLLFSIYKGFNEDERPTEEKQVKLAQVTQLAECLVALRTIFSMLDSEEVKKMFQQVVYEYDWNILPPAVYSAIIAIYKDKMREIYGDTKKRQ